MMFLGAFEAQTISRQDVNLRQIPLSGGATEIDNTKFKINTNNTITATTKEGKTETFENNQKGLDQLKSFIGEDVFRQFNSWVRETYDKRMKDAIASEIIQIKPKNYGPAVTRMVAGNLEEERTNRKKTAEKISAAKQLFAEAGANKTENLDKKDA